MGGRIGTGRGLLTGRGMSAFDEVAFVLAGLKGLVYRYNLSGNVCYSLGFGEVHKTAQLAFERAECKYNPEEAFSTGFHFVFLCDEDGESRMCMRHSIVDGKKLRSLSRLKRDTLNPREFWAINRLEKALKEEPAIHNESNLTRYPVG